MTGNREIDEALERAKGGLDAEVRRERYRERELQHAAELEAMRLRQRREDRDNADAVVWLLAVGLVVTLGLVAGMYALRWLALHVGGR